MNARTALDATPMHLDGKLAKRLCAALLAAFPRKYELEKMLLFELGEDLEKLTRAREHEERVFYVVKWAMTNGRVRELVKAGRAAAPDDAELAALDEAAPAGDDAATDGEGAAGAEPTGGAAGVPPGLAWKLWENGSTIRMTFLDGSPGLRERVKAVATEWTEHANLHFEVVDAADAEIRISFKQPGSWACTGTDALALTNASEPNVNFGWLEEHSPEEEVRRVVLHEMGHVLGLVHEFQSPNAAIAWDWDAVYAGLGGPPNFWTREDVERTLRPIAAEELPGYRAFDPESIMMFSFPAEYTKDRVALKQGGSLSASDVAFAAQLYPQDGVRLATARPRSGPPVLAPPPPRRRGRGRAAGDDRTAPAPPARTRAPAERGETAADSWYLLFFAAQPFDTTPLALTEEYQVMLENLDRSEAGKRIHLMFLPRVRFASVPRFLLNYEPLVVHFSGHGDSAGRLMFGDQADLAAPASVVMVGKLFATLRDRIRLVILNACYSLAQAAAICEHIDCVIGMSRAIPDTKAIAFAESFYMAIGYGRSVQTAFDLGCQKIAMTGSRRTPTARDAGEPDSGGPSPAADAEPVLLFREGVDPDRIVLLPGRD